MTTAERIARILREGIGIDVSSTSTDMVDAGLLDSLALVTLLVEVEQDFAITIPIDALDVESIRTIDRLAVLVDELAGAAERP